MDIKNFSFSAISSFKSCPRSFEFAYIKKMPEAFGSIERHMGQCVHEVLKWMYEERKADNDPGHARVQKKYEMNWAARDNDRIRVIKKNLEKRDYFNQGQQLLEGYFEQKFKTDRSKTLLLEHKFEIDLDAGEGIKYRGIIDRVATGPDGNIRVTDYKTGRIGQPRDNLQLPSYGLYLLQNQMNDEVELCYEGLQAGDTLVAVLRREEMGKIRDDLLAEIGNIRSCDQFQTKPSILCKWCGYFPMCDNPDPSVKEVVSPTKPDLSGPDLETACPQCGSQLMERSGKFGSFLGCSQYPECRYTLNISSPEENKELDASEVCPECGSRLRQRKGKYGPFFGCSNYPQCTFTRKIETDDGK